MLLSDSARAKIQAAFEQFGPQGKQLFTAFMDAVRLSLSTAISDLFLLATVVGLVGLVVVLFLREDPLRRTHMSMEEARYITGRPETETEA